MQSFVSIFASSFVVVHVFKQNIFVLFQYKFCVISLGRKTYIENEDDYTVRLADFKPTSTGTLYSLIDCWFLSVGVILNNRYINNFSVSSREKGFLLLKVTKYLLYIGYMYFFIACFYLLLTVATTVYHHYNSECDLTDLVTFGSALYLIYVGCVITFLYTYS